VLGDVPIPLFVHNLFPAVTAVKIERRIRQLAPSFGFYRLNSPENSDGGGERGKMEREWAGERVREG
jgi:hypothetical protein